jgi:hypothetical protein
MKPSHEYTQRRILYSNPCSHCTKHTVSCFHARQSAKSIIMEYCYCNNDPIVNKCSYICMQCGIRKKTGGEI